MSFMDRTEIKIFLTFFIIYSYFILWSGAAENGRFALTRSIVDDQTIIIDKYYNQTADRAYYNGHYYSDKAPGGSFLAVPVYAAWKFVYNFFPQGFRAQYSGSTDFIVYQRINEEDIIIIVNPGFFILTSMILVTIFTSSLFSSLTVLLVYKISRYLTKKKSHRILLAVIFGAGTLIFHYAIVFLGHSIETFFVFLAFYLLFKMRNEKKYDLKYFLASGVSAGYAITSGYPSMLIALACLAYAFSFKYNKNYFFMIGLILGLLPLFIYNFLIFSNPFDITSAHVDPKILQPESKELLLQGVGFSYIPNPLVILQLTVLPYKGMFFYYPILIFSLFGLFYMYKEYRLEAILIAISLIGFLIVFSSFVDWWHGGYFGFRHFLSIYPFLMLPLAYCFRTKNKIIWLVLIIFMAISIFHNFIGLTGSYSDVLRVKGVLEKKYFDDIKKGTVLEKPLYDFYLPLFLRDGPRSMIFENLVNGYIDIDIRAKSPYRGTLFPITGGFHIPFLSLLPVSIVLAIIWKNEILCAWRCVCPKKKKIIYFLVIISIGLAFTKISFYEKDIYLGDGWYPQAYKEIGRWLYKNGTIVINNRKGFDEDIIFSSVLSSYYRDRNASIYFNDELIDNFNVTSKFALEYSWFLKLKPGKNTVKIYSAECDYPYKIEEGKDDERCLNIHLENFLVKESTENLILSKGWYKIRGSDDVNWMYKEGVIQILNTEDYSKNMTINFVLRSFNESRTIDIYLNNVLIKPVPVTTQDNKFSFELNLKPKENYIVFTSRENCTIMGEVIGNDDTRCVTIGIKNLKLK